ncbi:hypothetical protein G7Y41_06955 [Schaalia sp. ZJ405]|uniref:hypothetical protein n=1 Tax=Schaalia sp. ZJ405 TaxID=2709403 RepID=UPI0013EA7F58|nr:hypothetical protein [Schaalia sp. ZJ405]QPK80793.1 hypothetical protein G7Y41_06955 [Schaalia sp. ZJ405]
MSARAVGAYVFVLAGWLVASAEAVPLGFAVVIACLLYAQGVRMIWVEAKENQR